MVLFIFLQIWSLEIFSCKAYICLSSKLWFSNYFSHNTISSAWSCSTALYKSVCHIPLVSVQWINSWWWTEELSETCRVSWQNKFVKLVHLVGFVTKKQFNNNCNTRIYFLCISAHAKYRKIGNVRITWYWVSFP